jgi:hypothetical protein
VQGKFGAKLDNNNVLVDFYGGGSSENKANFAQLGLELGHTWKYSDSAKTIQSDLSLQIEMFSEKVIRSTQFVSIFVRAKIMQCDTRHPVATYHRHSTNIHTAKKNLVIQIAHYS